MACEILFWEQALPGVGQGGGRRALDALKMTMAMEESN